MDSAPEVPVPATENGDSDESRPAKKPRLVGDGRAKKRVAEIVLVLAAMARLRGGKKPTEMEVALMAEAREKLAELCEGLAPKDIAAKEAVGAAIEDLGLNSRLKDQKLGFRGPRLTIAEKFSQTQRKMEDSRKASPFTPQPLHVRGIPSDKQSSQSIPGVNTSLPVGQVSTATSKSLNYPLPMNDVKPSPISNSFSSNNNMGREFPSNALPRFDRSQMKVEGGPIGSSYVSQQGQVSSSNPQFVNAPSWSVQNQASKSGLEQNKPPIHVPAKANAAPSQLNLPRVIPLPPRDQNFVPVLAQPAPINFPSVHQPSQPVNIPQPLSVGTYSHNEIAKIVQKLLQPKLPDHPTWIPPSRDYMNKALICQICQLIMTDVDNALVCDACEKGYHTKCAQSSNQRGIPRGEWHCSRCLALSNGKPLPPKYGRVMRSNTPIKGHLGTAGIQSVSDKKVVTTDPKLTRQNTTSNGSSALQSSAQTGNVALGSYNVASEVDSKMIDVEDAQKLNASSVNNAVNAKPVVGNCTNSSLKSSETTFASLDVSTSETSSQIANNSESSMCEDESVDLKPPLPGDPLPGTTETKVDCSQPSHALHVVDPSEKSNQAEDNMDCTQPSNASPIVELFEKSNQAEDNMDCSQPSHASLVVDPSEKSNQAEDNMDCSQPPHASPVVDPSEKSNHAEDYVENSQPSHASPVVDPSEKSNQAEDNMDCSQPSHASPIVDPSEKSNHTEDYAENSQPSHASLVVDPLVDSNHAKDNAEGSQPSHSPHVVDPSEQSNQAEDASRNPQDQNQTETALDNVTVNETSDGTLMDHSKEDEQSFTLDKTDTICETPIEVVEHSVISSNDSIPFEWIGNVIQVDDEKTFYQTCQVGEVTYNIQDHALFSFVPGKLTPVKIQSMWEDKKTGSKWVIANRYFLPSDLPESLGRPCSSSSSEVYESTQETTVMAGEIKGPCKVLPQTKFQEECGRRDQLSPESSCGLPPVYLCKWLYDEVKGSLQPISG